VLRRGLQLLGILTVLGCGDPVQLDLFAPGPTPDAQVDEFTASASDGGSPALRAARDAHVGGAIGEDASTGYGGTAQPASLILRYDFSGRGLALVDRVDARPARMLGGAELDGSGTLELDGVDDYVDLPEGTLASLESVTVVAWMVLRAGACRQPLFGFGESKAGPSSTDHAADMRAALAVSLSSCPLKDGGVELPTDGLSSGAFSIARDRSFQIALSYDAARAVKTLYVNGLRVSEGPIRYQLSELGQGAWLGRMPASDDYSRASYDEFRLYDGALTRTEVFELYVRGPDRP
jgi:hypothetical protein